MTKQEKLKMYDELTTQYAGKSFLIREGHERTGEVADFVRFDLVGGVPAVMLRSHKDKKEFAVYSPVNLYRIEKEVGHAK